MRVDLKDWRQEDERVFFTVTSSREIDERNTRYIDRSDTFDDAKVEDRSADGTQMTFSAGIKQQYFLFGTDNTGRDLLSRTLMAGRVSLAIGLLAGVVAVVIGVLYGATAGFIGGKTDEVMMRIVDVLYSLPFIFFVIMLVVFFGRNFVLMFLAVGAVLWLDMARIVRGQALSIRRQEYVQAAEALGVSPRGILLRHIVPNLLGPVVIYMTLLVPQVIILESFLSFLGLGVQEPMTSWGVLISTGAKNIGSANWLLLFPAIFLVSTLFALNFVGDGLRDALDPKDR
jgi:oligopeptide transport system permease protein